MKKQLPKIQRKIKELILEEDAKLIDKKVTKLALYSSLFSISFLTQSHEVDAYSSHSSHDNHSNMDNFQGSNQTIRGDWEGRPQDENLPGIFNGVNLEKVTTTTGLPPKSITAIHNNHWNHESASGYGFPIISDILGTKPDIDIKNLDIKSNQVNYDGVAQAELLDDEFSINYNLSNGKAPEAEYYENSNENLVKGNHNKPE